MNYLELLITTLPGQLIGSIPALLAWLVGIVLAVRMLRRGGGRPEKLLLIGCSLMFAGRILRPFLQGLAIWLPTVNEITRVHAAMLFLSLPRSILDMAAIVCLVLAFWFRWRTRSAVTQ